MNPGLRQLGFAVVGLAVLTVIGAQTIDSGRPSPAPPATVAAATAQAVSVVEVVAPPAKVSVPTSEPAATATTSTTAPVRTISVEVHPDDASVETSVTDAAGTSFEGSTTVEAVVAGPSTITVVGDGYRPEQIEVPSDTAGTVEVWLDPPDQLLDRRMVIGAGDAPKQVAFTPDGSELWVTLLGGTGLEAYDPVTGEKIAAIDLPEAGSVEVIFDAAGATAYVSQMETASVYEVDVGTHRVRRRLETGGSWTKVMLLSADEQTLWTSNWVSNDVSEFDLATGEVVRRISTVATPRGLAVDGAGSTLYVAGYDNGELQAIDLDTGEGRILHTTGGALRHLAAAPNGDVVYASDMATDQILAIDTATQAVTVLGSTDRLPNTIDISPDGRVLAVSNRGRNNPESYYLPGPEWGSVLLLDTRTGEILDAVVGGNQPTGLDISPDGRWLAYSDFLDDRITVLRLPSTDALLAGDGGRSAGYRTELEK